MSQHRSSRRAAYGPREHELKTRPPTRDPLERLYAAAELMGFDLAEARRYLTAARSAFPNESQDDLLTIAIRSMSVGRQQLALEAAKTSIGQVTP